MNLKLRLNNQIYTVRIGSLHERPILVEVEGDIFEVWPEMDTRVPDDQSLEFNPHNTEKHAIDLKSETRIPQANNLKHRYYKSEELEYQQIKLIKAPIPGIITAIRITVGSEVKVGQELLKLEAMKMNNSICSNHTGTIRAINVSVGQIVKQNQTLLEFE